MRQDRVALIAMHRCIYCRVNRADDGYRSCLQCRIDRRGTKDTHSDEFKRKHNEWLKRRRDLLYAFGVCITCGKRDAKAGSHQCERCLAKARIRMEQKRREAGIIPRDSYMLQGKCYYCNEPSIEGKRTCQKHYEIAKKNMIHARKFKVNENYFEIQNRLYWTVKQKNGNRIRYSRCRGQ